MDYCLYNGQRYKVYDSGTVFEEYTGNWILGMIIDRNDEMRRFIVLEASMEKGDIIRKVKVYLAKGVDVIFFPVFDDLEAIKKYIALGGDFLEVDYVTPREHSLFWSLYLGLPVPEEYLN